MRTELKSILTAYLQGWRPLADCYVWLSAVSWSDPALGLDSDLKETLGILELLATEASEGLRPESEFQEKAADIIAAWSNTRYAIYGAFPEPRVFASSNDEVVQPSVTSALLVRKLSNK